MRGKTRGAVGGLLSVTALLSGCGSAPAATTYSSGVVASLGREVHDGSFAFTVTRFDSDLPRIRDHFPHGEYVAVIVTVKNVGNHPETYVGADQKLTDIAGKTYSSDSAVDATLNEDGISTDINPGHQVQVVLVFDVPPGTVPALVELHDSASSTGATVNLDHYAFGAQGHRSGSRCLSRRSRLRTRPDPHICLIGHRWGGHRSPDIAGLRAMDCLADPGRQCPATHRDYDAGWLHRSATDQ